MIAKAGKYFSKSNNSKNHQWYHINLISSLTLSHKRSTLNFVYKQNLGKYCFTRSCSLKNPIHHPKRKKKFLSLVNVRYYTGNCKTNKQTNKHAREIKWTTSMYLTFMRVVAVVNGEGWQSVEGFIPRKRVRG